LIILSTRTLSGSTQQVLHLEVGQPSTGAPVLVKEAAVKALQGDKLGYTEAFGIRPLRERLAQVKNLKVILHSDFMQ
jgi:aspartate/methionine/tyrosine aminotransferase